MLLNKDATWKDSCLWLGAWESSFLWDPGRVPVRPGIVTGAGASSIILGVSEHLRSSCF